MRRKYAILVLLLIFVFPSMGVSAQKVQVKNTFGIYVGAGFSNLFLGDQFDSNNSVIHPLLGGGTTIGFEYELAFKHLLLQTGFGIDYSINNNQIEVETFSVGIKEYPTMQYHYTVNNYKERDTYGVGYIPIKIGATFKYWYFLAGAKIGLFSFANYTRSAADVTIWASDEDVIDPLVNQPTHYLQTYYAQSDAKSIDFSMVNAMLSAEIGVKLDSKLWHKTNRRLITNELISEKCNLHYRLALFADYGLKNLHVYRANPIPYNGQKEGGLMGLKDVAHLDTYSILGYEPYKHLALNNLLVGVKLSIQFELPKKDVCNCIYP